MGGRGVYSLTGQKNRKLRLASQRSSAKAPATIESRKITDYLLKRREKDDKAGYFIDVLGYSPDEPDRLARDLLEGLQGSRFVGSKSGYNGATNESYVMELGVSERRLTRTVWQTDASGDMKFITAYPYREEENL